MNCPGWLRLRYLVPVLLVSAGLAIGCGDSAHQAGTAHDGAAVEGGVRVSVLDRGAGMTDEAFKQVSLPFFTTKPTGSGIGLALCREIVQKHRGRFRLARREGGGMAISFWLPGRGVAAPISKVQARLSLTRA